jgi:PAS domain S-box-containing protein
VIAVTHPSSSSLDFLRGGGETGELARSTDWTKTPLGAPATWSPALRTVLGIMFNTRHPMFLFWGPEHVQFYNDAYLPSFGKGKHPAAMGQRGVECWPEIWDAIGPQIRGVMEQGLPTWHENQLLPIYRNGQLEDVYWTYSYSPVFEADGSVGGTLVVCTETTGAVVSRQEIERAREDAERARERLGALFQNAPAFVCTLRGPEHVFELVNAPYEALVGRGRELVGKPIRDALPEIVEQGFSALLDSVYRSNEPFVGRETFVRLDRTARGVLEDAYVTFVYQPRHDDHGLVDGIDVFGFDVTEQVRARNQAQAASDEHRALTEAIPQQVWTSKPDGRLDFVNDRVLEYFASSREAILGAGWQAVIHPDDLSSCVARWSHALATGDHYEVEFRLRRADGVYRWHLARALPLRDRDGAIIRWFGTNTDIDEHKKMREELNQRTELEQHLLGIVSHDLRNPLSAILLGARVLAANESLDERAARVLLRITSSAERCGRMIRDLLDFTQARVGGGIPISRAALDIHALAAQAVEEVRAAHPERRLVTLQHGDGTGSWDGDRINQVLVNLLSNALHYGEPDGAVTVTTRGERDQVVIEVHNGGEPITPEVAAVLFTPMKRGTSDSTRSGRSIGLGLYIVKAIVDGHHGTVAVRSSRESGTVFSVCLPR